MVLFWIVVHAALVWFELVWFGLANYAQVNVPWVGFFGAGMVWTG